MSGASLELETNRLEPGRNVVVRAGGGGGEAWIVESRDVEQLGSGRDATDHLRLATDRRPDEPAARTLLREWLRRDLPGTRLEIEDSLRRLSEELAALPEAKTPATVPVGRPSIKRVGFVAGAVLLVAAAASMALPPFQLFGRSSEETERPEPEPPAASAADWAVAAGGSAARPAATMRPFLQHMGLVDGAGGGLPEDWPETLNAAAAAALPDVDPPKRPREFLRRLFGSPPSAEADAFRPFGLFDAEAAGVLKDLFGDEPPPELPAVLRDAAAALPSEEPRGVLEPLLNRFLLGDGTADDGTADDGAGDPPAAGKREETTTKPLSLPNVAGPREAAFLRRLGGKIRPDRKLDADLLYDLLEAIETANVKRTPSESAD